MAGEGIDYERLVARGLPAPAGRWSGFPRYNFVGGHNDPSLLPVADLADAAAAVVRENGQAFATYNAWGPLGFLGLRSFVARKLTETRGIACGPDEVLITSGSLQALDLVNEVLLEPGDTVLVEEHTYGGMLSRIARRKVQAIPVPLDERGIVVPALETILDGLRARGIRPKYLYTIPTVQNPTGSVLPLERRQAVLALTRRHGVPIFEDECYADLLWEGDWPPALRGLGGDNVVHIGSFSKSLAPALRLGYVNAPWAILSRLLACKTDGGTPALEQMVVAHFFERSFEAHVRGLKAGLRRKLDILIDAIEQEFGTSAEFTRPKGGIFLWLGLPDAVDTSALAKPAQAEGIAFNPGAEWSAEPGAGRHHMRLCFALAEEAELRQGIAALARVCHRETGVPVRGGNIERDR